MKTPFPVQNMLSVARTRKLVIASGQIHGGKYLTNYLRETFDTQQKT